MDVYTQAAKAPLNIPDDYHHEVNMYTVNLI